MAKVPDPPKNQPPPYAPLSEGDAGGTSLSRTLHESMGTIQLKGNNLAYTVLVHIQLELQLTRTMHMRDADTW